MLSSDLYTGLTSRVSQTPGLLHEIGEQGREWDEIPIVWELGFLWQFKL